MESKQVWFDIDSILSQRLILDTKGNENYRYVTRLISSGRLKAKKIGNKYVVHKEWIDEYNSPSNE